MKHIKTIFCLFLAIQAGAGLCAYEKNFAPVNDPAHLLTKAQADGISAQIQNLKNETGPEIAVVILDKQENADLASFAADYLAKNKTGRPGYDDGLVLAVSYPAHKIKILSGKGLEQIITADVAEIIIENIMIPEFKNEKYFDGIDKAVKELKKLITLNKDLIGAKH
jgi:uncharacterized protein